MKTPRLIPQVTVYSRHRNSEVRDNNGKITRKRCPFVGKDRVTECDCPKMLVWYRDGKLYREAAGTCDAQVAKDKADEMNARFAGKEPPKKQAASNGKLLEDAITDFLTSKRQNNLSEKHVAKLNFELTEFSKFALSRGLVMVSDVLTEHVLAWRNTLQGAQNTKAKKVFRVIGFFEFCVEMGWITRNVARAQSIVFRYDDSQTPKALTDPQFEILLAAVAKVNGQTTDDQRRKLRALLLLMRWTGLAIRDAVTIERARFQQNGNGFTKLFLYRAKTGHPVYCTVRDEIVAGVFAGANPEGRYLFVDAVPEAERELDNLIQAWGNLMRKLGKVAELKDENGQPFHFTSHSMRHTFVFWCLNTGLPTEDVAMLIGDTLQIVAKHYSAWINGRQERLNERMMAALNAQ